MLIYYPFYARSADVEEMIQRRLEERSGHQEQQDGLWASDVLLG